MLENQPDFTIDVTLDLEDSLESLLQLEDRTSPLADGSVVFPKDPSETLLALKVVLDLGFDSFVVSSLDFSTDIRVGFSTCS